MVRLYKMTCPTCSVLTNFFSIFRDGIAENRNVTVGGEIVDAQTLEYQLGRDERGMHDLVKCMGCGAVHHGVHERVQLGETGASTHSDDPRIADLVWISPDSLPEAIPDAVRKDWAEAKSAYNAGLPNACATMARRALERACKQKGATSGNLKAKVETVLKNDLELLETANEIRFIGNEGAHANESPQWDLTLEEAGDAIEFLEDFLHEQYIKPWKRKKSKEQRKKRKAEKKASGTS